jgi:hypothetical protein
MDFKKGYTIKPYETSNSGNVIFTDGTNNNITPNQSQCEAYGYTYDRATATCRAFRYNTTLEQNLGNIDNKINGPLNIIGTGGVNVQINGTGNTAKGDNRDCFISGSKNTIANGVNNATVVGSNGTAVSDGQFIVGTNAGSNTSFNLNRETTDGTATALYVDGDSSITALPREDVDFPYFFTIDVFAFRKGGSSGSGAVGDRVFIKIYGMVQDTTVTQSTTTLLTLGTTTGWTASCSIVGADLLLKVTGAASMTIQWQAKADFNKMIGT